MHVVPFLIGEPHIDGEPGDLKFIIKELRYSSVDFKKLYYYLGSFSNPYDCFFVSAGMRDFKEEEMIFIQMWL